VEGGPPSVDGFTPLTYKDELKPAFERVRTYADGMGGADFAAGVLATIDTSTFRAYTVVRSDGKLAALDVTFDRVSRLPLRAVSVVSVPNAVFTWAGVVGIASIWFDTLKER
jgi:hypothetical protein